MQVLLLVLQIFACIALVILAWLVVVHPIARLLRRSTGLPDPTLVIRLINNPVRRKFQAPGKVVDHVDIHDGMKVLELGPGAEKRVLSWWETMAVFSSTRLRSDR
jgi:hypothetical protein